MASALHPIILTAAEGSVRKTYYKRDFAFLVQFPLHLSGLFSTAHSFI